MTLHTLTRVACMLYLSNNSGPSRPSDSPTKGDDEDGVQNDVDAIANKGGVQGATGVTQASEYPLQQTSFGYSWQGHKASLSQ